MLTVVLPLVRPVKRHPRQALTGGFGHLFLVSFVFVKHMLVCIKSRKKAAQPPTVLETTLQTNPQTHLLLQRVHARELNQLLQRPPRAQVPEPQERVRLGGVALVGGVVVP
jgi:hypothetical protein